MISFVLPLPLVAESYWKVFVPGGEKDPGAWVTQEGRIYREQVREVVRQAGLISPFGGQVMLSWVLYPERPDNWRDLFRRNPEGWDDAIVSDGLDSVQRVLVDALTGVAFADEKGLRKVEAERAVPDGCARVEVRLEAMAGEGEAWRLVNGEDETDGRMAYFYAPGTIVSTPSGRKAVVLRYRHGTGRKDMHERAICRYLDSPSEKACVTLQPRYLRRISPAEEA